MDKLVNIKRVLDSQSNSLFNRIVRFLYTNFTSERIRNLIDKFTHEQGNIYNIEQILDISIKDLLSLSDDDLKKKIFDYKWFCGGLGIVESVADIFWKYTYYRMFWDMILNKGLPVFVCRVYSPNNNVAKFDKDIVWYRIDSNELKYIKCQKSHFNYFDHINIKQDNIYNDLKKFETQILGFDIDSKVGII